jgi:lipopolysaccharide transport system permease protein
MEATATRHYSLAAAARASSAAWDLLLAITARDLRVTYQATFLSYLWWIARPLATGFVMYFALGRVLGVGARLGIPNFAVFLLSALFPWFWFSGSVQQSAGAFVANGGLLKKVQFPRLILPLSAVFHNAMQFLFSLPVLAFFVVIAGVDPDVAWVVGIPILFALQLLLLVGLGALLASITVFLRDLQPFLGVVLLLMFYGSPIIYPFERVPERFKPFVLLNPAAPLLEGWRKLFLEGSVPGTDLWPTIVATAVLLVLGLGVFRVLEKYFADAL